MALTSKKRIAAGSTHFPNMEKKAPGDQESGSKVKNHYEAQDLLVDPQDDLEGTSTHTPIEAKAKPAKVQAADFDEDLNIDSLDEVDALYEEGDEDLELESDVDDGTTDSILDEGEDAETVELLDEIVDDADDAVESDVEEDLGTEDVAEEEFAAEGIPLVDVDAVADEMDDAEQDLAIASIGASLHVIHRNRIIASMTKKQAVTANKADLYLEDSFPSVVCAEVQKMGLRKGLTAMGFTLSAVAVGGAKAIKAAIAQKVTAATIKANREVKATQEAFAQSLAIASVGLNRRFFKDTTNELKAGMEAELQAAGVRGASKIVSAMFAKHGISYANTLVTLATKISAMPEETRDQFAEALDLTDDGVDEDDDNELEAESDFDPDEDSEELEVPSTVSAALSRPLRRVDVRASRNSGSTTVRDVLSGAQPLPFL